MICLTRINNKPLVINSDLIEYIETTPDTVIALTSGAKILVAEPADEVIARVVSFRRSILEAIATPTASGYIACKNSAGEPNVSGTFQPNS